MMERVPLIACFVVLVALATWYHFSRAEMLLRRWADRNEYTLLSKTRRYLRRGPFLLRSTEKQMVYHVTVRDTQGNTRSGYVRCGSWLFGIMTSETTVKWDE